MDGKEKESRCPGSKGRRSNTGKVEIFAAPDFKKRHWEKSKGNDRCRVLKKENENSNFSNKNKTKIVWN